ncbi:MAG TPA: AAA family ATPase, partial [Terrimesophilobacter sp.]|nr:AAA family ATPase [Terrimesophilobacter sp.]
MLPQDPPSRRLTRLCPILIGRDDLLSLAMRRWSSAEEGSGQLLLLAGEAGVGKSRLLAEFEERVGGRARVFSTTAFPRDAESAGGVFLDLVAALRRAGATGFAARLRKALHEIGDSKPASRRTLVAELCEVLVDLVDGGAPVLLMIEDLHWVDELSLEVLGRLAVAARSTSLLLVGSYRSDELYPRSPLRLWRSRLVGQRLAEEVRLQRLDAADTAEMAAAITGRLPSSTFIDALFDRSDGIPLHIEELITGGTAAGVPDTVAEAMLARLEALTPQTRSTVTAAAVIGRSFDIDLLAAVTSDSPDAVDAGLLELAERQLVLPRADGVSFDFRHALIRDAIYESIPPNRRRALHAAVAAAAVAAGFRDSFLSDQFERAGQKGDAYRSARAAAVAAMHLSAHREAAELYRRAQRVMPADVPLRERAALHAAVAAELAATDDNEGAEGEYTLAVDLYRRLGDEVEAAGLVPGLMAVRHLFGAHLDARVALARDALSRLSLLADGGPDLIRARLLAALAAAYMLDRRLDESIDLARQAARVVPESAIEERVNIDATLGSVLVFAGQSADGWTALERSIVDGEEARAEAETARAYRMIGSCTSVLVEYDRGEEWLPRGISYTARTERWNDHHYLAAHLAHLHWATGDWAAAELGAQQALADGRGGITTR